MKRKPNAVELARQLLAALGTAEDTAPEQEPDLDEAAIQARADKTAERMLRARQR